MTTKKTFSNVTPWTNVQYRNGAFPLEAYSIFSSYSEASAYANEVGEYSGLAYEGQLIAISSENGQQVYVLDASAPDGLKKLVEDDERATVIMFDDNTTSSYNWIGELSWETIANEPTIGWDSTYLTWNKLPSSVKIGTSISSIGQAAFNGCGTLSNVIIPNSVISIGRSAFNSCSFLNQIIIPQSITSIDDWAFTWTGINEIVIPSNITNIGENVFSNCFNLTSIIVEGKTQAQAEALLVDASVPLGCEITTWNDASQEWTTKNFYTKSETSSASEISDALDKKIFFDNRLSNVNGYNDLSIIKLSVDEYAQIVDNEKCLSNAIYIVETPTLNAFNQRVTNVAPAVDLSDAVNLEQLSNAIYASKVFIKDPSVNELSDGAKSDLSIIKLTTEEYAQILSTGSTQPNTLYIISSNNINAYGQNIKNVAPAVDLSDAVNLEQLSNAISSIDLSNYLDRHTGGEVSGDVKILSGNYIQTTTPEKVFNYSAKNSFLQAEYAPDYGIAYTGTMGYCILSVLSAENKVQLSGDISLLKDIYDGKITTGNIDSANLLSSSLALKVVLGKDITNDRVGTSSNLSSAKFSIALSSRSTPSFFTLADVDSSTGWVTLNEPLSSNGYNIQQYDGQSPEFFTETTWLNDDNAFYLAGFPEVGNQKIKNFYSNHAEGGSTRAIGKYTHTEGRDTIANMRYAHAEGAHTVADEMATHAEGFMTVANGRYSHSEGFQALANGQQSHAEGQNTTASGNQAHAEGLKTYAIGSTSHAEGNKTYAIGNCSHVEGYGDTLWLTMSKKNTHTLFSSNGGLSSYAENGVMVVIDDDYSISGEVSSYALSPENKISVYLKNDIPELASKPSLFKVRFIKQYASGIGSHVEGQYTHSRGTASHSSGIRAYADNDYSFAWNGISSEPYFSNGEGTFNVNPKDGAAGFYIGHESLDSIVNVDRHTYFTVETTTEYKKVGIYSAQKDDPTKPILIDWGDGIIEQMNGNVSQKVHEYANVGTFNVVLKNAVGIVMGSPDTSQTWIANTSNNSYTLKSVKFGENLVQIDTNALRQCSAVVDVKLPSSISSIGGYAFNRCGISSIDIPDSIKLINSYSFGACKSLSSLHIPKGTTDILSNAFASCSELKTATIENTVSSIGNGAFTTCANLTSIVFKDRLSSEIPSGARWSATNATVTTWNDASQEWVKEQNYIFSNALTAAGIGADTELSDIQVEDVFKVIYNLKSLLM